MAWINNKLPIRFGTRWMLAALTLICVVIGLQVRAEQNLRQHVSGFFDIENAREFDVPGKLAGLRSVKTKMESGLVDYLLFRRRLTLVYEAQFVRNRILYTQTDKFNCETSFLVGILEVKETAHQKKGISFGLKTNKLLEFD